MASKEAKADMGIHLVIAEDKMRKCLCNLELYKPLCAFYSSIHFDLFLQLNNFLFHLYFSVQILDLCFLLPFFKSNYIFLVKQRVFDISTESCSLIFFLSSFLHLLQIIERTSVFSKRHDILGFSNFLYLPQLMKKIFHHFSYSKYFSIILSLF